MASESQVARSHLVKSYLQNLRPVAPPFRSGAEYVIDETFILRTKRWAVSIVNTTWMYQRSFPQLSINPQDGSECGGGQP